MTKIQTVFKCCSALIMSINYHVQFLHVHYFMIGLCGLRICVSPGPFADCVSPKNVSFFQWVFPKEAWFERTVTSSFSHMCKMSLQSCACNFSNKIEIQYFSLFYIIFIFVLNTGENQFRIFSDRATSSRRIFLLIGWPVCTSKRERTLRSLLFSVSGPERLLFAVSDARSERKSWGR